MLKSLARLALIAAALVLVSSAAFGQAPSNKASQQLDSLASASRSQRVEIAACVAGTVTHIDSLTAANVAWADSLSVHPPLGETLCPRGVVWVHSHVAKNGILGIPSSTDRRTTHYVHAPYALILVVTDSARWLVRY